MHNMPDGTESPSAESATGESRCERVAASSLVCVATLYPPLLSVCDSEDSPQAASLSYTDSSPAWQVSFSVDGAWLVVAVGSPSSCIRVYHNPSLLLSRQSKQQRSLPLGGYDQDHSVQKNWILHASLQTSDTQSFRTVRSVAVAPFRTLRDNNDEISVMLASASFDGNIRIWEYHGHTQDHKSLSTASAASRTHPNHHDWHCVTQLEGHESEVKCVVWNATGTLLASCGRDKTVWIWEHVAADTPYPSGVGSQLYSGGSSSDWECLSVLPGHEADVKCLQFAASHDLWGDGDEILLSGSYDDSVKVWAEDAGEWYCAASITNVHSSTVWSLAVAPSSTRFVSGSADGSLAIYKCYSTMEFRQKFPQEAMTLETRSSDGIWKCVGRLPDAHSEPVYSVSYASARCGHGRIVSGGGDGLIQVYRETLNSTPDMPTFVVDASVFSEHGDVNHVCWHPWDGSILVSTGDDGSVRLWRYTSA